MYRLSDQQINFILDDIKNRGISLEDLQSNLLDHICCLIEEGLEANGDFEAFYAQTINRFYRHELREIESETQSLLTFKHYYTMKKVMMTSGITAAAMLTAGMFLKFGHLPGAGVMIVSGIGLLSLVFLPLVAMLKIRERSEKREKLLLVTGVIAGIALSLGTLFKVMYWPGANMLGMASILMWLLIYLPIYFFTNIRHPDRKTNTIVNSILILSGCGLMLTLVRTPAGTEKVYLQNTRAYLHQESLLDREKRIMALHRESGSPVLLVNESNRINALCEDIKSFIIRCETGANTIGQDFETSGNYLGDTRIDKFIADNKEASEKLGQLRVAALQYNKSIDSGNRNGAIPLASVVLESDEYRTPDALNGLVQIQLSLLQNERLMVQTN